MDTQKTKEVVKLNQLISRNYDAEQGYKEAVQRAENPSLKSFFANKVEERYKFGHDIKPMIIVDGGEVDKGTSVAGDLHRAFMKIKDVATGSNDEAIIEECIRGEEFAKKDYEGVIESDELSDNNKSVYKEHLSKIEESLTKLHALKVSLN